MSNRHKRRKITDFGANVLLDKALEVGGLIGAYMHDEMSDAISYDQSGLGHNGLYVATTHGQPGVPGLGRPSMGFDGAASFNNIHSAGFANDNRLLNPGFETPGAGPPVFLNWIENVGDGAIASEGVIVHQGADSAKLTSGLTSNTLLRTAVPVVVAPGVIERLRLWTRGDGANEGRYEIWDATNAASITGQVATGVTAAAWGMLPIIFTPPPGCITVHIYLYCSAVNGGVCYFDAGEIRRMNGFLPDRGTFLVPAQVANVGVWTDGVQRYIFHSYADGNNFISISRPVVNNNIQFRHKVGGVDEIQSTAGLDSVDFVRYGITWDISAGATGEVRYYIDGMPGGAMDVGLGTWVGNLNPANTIVGAYSTGPAGSWSGNLAPALVFNEAKTPAEMLYLST